MGVLRVGGQKVTREHGQGWPRTRGGTWTVRGRRSLCPGRGHREGREERAGCEGTGGGLLSKGSKQIEDRAGVHLGGPRDHEQVRKKSSN